MEAFRDFKIWVCALLELTSQNLNFFIEKFENSEKQNPAPVFLISKFWEPKFCNEKLTNYHEVHPCKTTNIVYMPSFVLYKDFLVIMLDKIVSWNRSCLNKKVFVMYSQFFSIIKKCLFFDEIFVGTYFGQTILLLIIIIYGSISSPMKCIS